MMIARRLQFLVCPQRDFIGRLRRDEAPPNRLHIGYESARTLRGDGDASDPFVDTVSQFFDEAHAGASNVLVIVEADWHPKSCYEFEIFGVHCVKGSDGAKLAGKLEDYRRHERLREIRANSLNVAASKQYDEVLAEACEGQKPEYMRCGIAGVWTHVKVEYLALNLTTLKPWFKPAQIGICAPLCASPERADHEAALVKFRMLGYTVFTEIPAYLKWMGLDTANRLAATIVRKRS